MAKIRLSRKALADLDGIWNYTLETWSEDQAIIYYRQIYGAIQGLNSLPVFLERSYDVVKPGLFGFKVGHHIVFYKEEMIWQNVDSEGDTRHFVNSKFWMNHGE